MPYQMANLILPEQGRAPLKYSIPRCIAQKKYTGRLSRTVTRSPPFAYFKCL
jgi:hypothetical protein